MSFLHPVAPVYRKIIRGQMVGDISPFNGSMALPLKVVDWDVAINILWRTVTE
jgi:hypothetical protein